LAIFCLVYGKLKNYAVQSLLRQFEAEFEMGPAQVRPFLLSTPRDLFICILQLSSATVSLRTGASKVFKIGKVQKALDRQMSGADGRGNFLLFMDTHSDYETGWVAHATRKSDGAQLVQPASEVGF
jgi:hypothetical protein